MSMRPFAASLNVPAADRDFAGDVEYYLTLEPRQLPSRYLYDPLGSALFDAICELPWYRITRAELGLLDTHARAILAHTAPPAGLSRIVELGPGNGTKLLTLVEAGRRGPAEAGHYVPLHLHLIDVSAKALDQASDALAGLDEVEIVKHRATYESGLREVAQTGERTLVLFLGSNIGNFDRPGADAFLRSIRAALDPGDDLLVGADLVKPECELLLAYDDPLGVTVKFAIHPVAGRMPGHMNVLLAEADIPYTDLMEMEEINSDMPQCDVALVVGANDVVNPAARSDKSSPIYGMPIIDADKARSVFAIKRSKNPGFAGIDNDLYFSDRTWMLFGDAKGVIGDLVKQLAGDASIH